MYILRFVSQELLERLSGPCADLTHVTKTSVCHLGKFTEIEMTHEKGQVHIIVSTSSATETDFVHEPRG